MKRIFAWQTDTSTCHLYRTQFPFQELEKDGWQVAWGTPPPDIMDYDVVVGQRIAGDQPVWRELARNFKGLLVYDLDDDLIDVDPSNTIPYEIYQPQRLDTLININGADVVTVSTPHLAEKIRPINPEVVVLPNCIHSSWLQRNEPRGHTVGWAGSPFHRQDFEHEFMLELDRAVKKHPYITFHSMGGKYLPGRHTGLQPMERALAQMDFWVGLAPLVNNAFNQSKSWCKALEYGCRGIPVIASNVGQYTEWIETGGGGMLVGVPGDWAHRIDLIMDEEFRRTLSNQAYQRAEAQTIDKHAHKWAAVYSGEW